MTTYMSVSDVQAYFEKMGFVMPNPPFKVHDFQGIDSILCDDIKRYIGVAKFRQMQCEVVSMMPEGVSIFQS